MGIKLLSGFKGTRPPCSLSAVLCWDLSRAWSVRNETKCCFENKRKMKQCKGGQSGVAVNSDLSQMACERVRQLLSRDICCNFNCHFFRSILLFGIELILIFIGRTHTIISALMGFTLVENGGEGVNVGNPNIFNGSGVFKVTCDVVGGEDVWR